MTSAPQLSLDGIFHSVVSEFTFGCFLCGFCNLSPATSQVLRYGACGCWGYRLHLPPENAGFNLFILIYQNQIAWGKVFVGGWWIWGLLVTILPMRFVFITSCCSLMFFTLTCWYQAEQKIGSVSGNAKSSSFLKSHAFLCKKTTNLLK